MNRILGYQPQYSNSWALVIGINKYQNVSPLGYATNDAVALAELLEKRFKFPKENISLLIDEAGTREAIRKAFMDYMVKNRTQPDDRLLIFFAGHGHTETGKRGEVGFLVPVDGNVSDLSTLIRWDEFTRNADLIPAKHIFFLMDACYGGLALLRRPAFGSMRFLGDMLQRYARQVLTAGKADETVADGNGIKPGHSIFTAHLLNALEGSAATAEGVITANGVMAYVYDRVARDQYSHQTPHYGFIDGDGDFIFDTAIIDQLRGPEKSSIPENDKEEGTKDILINTSPQIIPLLDHGFSVIDTMKELLSDPAKKIKLDDFVTLYIKNFLDISDLRHFPVEGTAVTKEAFNERLDKYNEIIKDLQQIVMLLSKWGDTGQLIQLEKIFKRLAEADKGMGGLVVWLQLAWYPIMVLMYSAGITALSNRNYNALKIIFQTPVQPNPIDSNNGRLPILLPVMRNMVSLYNEFKWIPGQDRKYVPRSEYLLTLLQPTLEDILLLGRSYEPLFDDFEVLLALVYSDLTDQGWGPPGRFGWKYRRGYGESPFDRLIEEATKEGKDWGPFRAGLFQGSSERFLKEVEAYKEQLKNLNWY